MNRSRFTALVLLAAGCNDASLVPLVEDRVESHQQSSGARAGDPVDVLFVIDDSGSMSEEQALLANGFDAFAQPFLDAGLDFHLGVTSADPTDEAGRLIGDPPVLTPGSADFASVFRDRALLGTDGFRREAGLEVARAAVGEPLASADNAGFVRAGANLAVVFLSDEDDQSLPPQASEPPSGDLEDPAWRAANLTPVGDLVRDILAVKDGDAERVFAAAIVGDPIGSPSSMDATCGTALGGHRYGEAVSALGGFWRSICGDQDAFREILAEIAGRASFGRLRDAFATDVEPVPGTITVTVDGESIPEDPVAGWQWVPGQGVVFAETAVPPACASVVIRYQVPEGVVAPPATPRHVPSCDP